MTTLAAKGLLFDMDGTLIDSTQCIELIWRRWADRHGIDFAAILQVMHGRKGSETVAIVAPHLNAEAETAALIAEELHSLDGTVALPGALELLSQLSTEQWAVVTSAPRELALAKLKFAGLPLPQHLIGAEDVAQGKPHPAPFLQGAALLQLAADDCIAFEDASNGIRSAHAAGATVIAIHSDQTGLAQRCIANFQQLRLSQSEQSLTLSFTA